MLASIPTIIMVTISSLSVKPWDRVDRIGSAFSILDEVKIESSH